MKSFIYPERMQSVRTGECRKHVRNQLTTAHLEKSIELCVYRMIQRKTVQNSLHQYFATVSHNSMQFSPKCSEIIYTKTDNFNIAFMYFLFSNK